MTRDSEPLPVSTERIRQFSTNPTFGDLIAGPNRAWLSLYTETAIDPHQTIVDAHHHLWDLPRAPYVTEQLLRDLRSGHRIVGTVFVQCSEGYLSDGPAELRPVGETLFVRRIIEECTARGFPSACSAIVGYADLRAGTAVDGVLEAHGAAGAGRFRGIRQAAVWDASGALHATLASPPENLLSDRRFREGFSRLSAAELSFDAWVYHHQLGDVTDLAHTFPETTIIINHTGGPIGMGPYVDRGAEVFEVWRNGIRSAATCPRVFVKLGGLGMPLSGFNFHERAMPPTSDALAEAWKPWFETCIEAFGPDRCMFESNFPVDNMSFDYTVLWNAYKKLAANFSAAEKEALFNRSATSAYRLALPLVCL